MFIFEWCWISKQYLNRLYRSYVLLGVHVQQEVVTFRIDSQHLKVSITRLIRHTKGTAANSFTLAEKIPSYDFRVLINKKVIKILLTNNAATFLMHIQLLNQIIFPTYINNSNK